MSSNRKFQNSFLEILYQIGRIIWGILVVLGTLVAGLLFERSTCAFVFGADEKRNQTNRIEELLRDIKEGKR